MARKESVQIVRKRITKPTVMTSEVVRNLCDCLIDGYSIEFACEISRVSRSTYYSYIRKHPDQARAFEIIRRMPVEQAEANINNALFAGNIKVSQWYLERVKPEVFNPNNLTEVKVSAKFKTRFKRSGLNNI